MVLSMIYVINLLNYATVMLCCEWLIKGLNDKDRFVRFKD